MMWRNKIIDRIFGRNNVDDYSTRLLHWIFPRTFLLFEEHEPRLSFLDEIELENKK